MRFYIWATISYKYHVSIHADADHQKKGVQSPVVDADGRGADR